MNIAAILNTAFPGQSYAIDGDDYKTLVWPDRNTVPKPTLEEIEALESSWISKKKLSVLSAYRYQKENGGVSVGGGITIQTDRESRPNLIGARINAIEDPSFVLKWKVQDKFIDLSANQIIAISDAARIHVQKCFEAEASVAEKIDQISEDSIAAAFDEAYLNASQ